jgi:fibronectin-binding autotransporter adhesin
VTLMGVTSVSAGSFTTQDGVQVDLNSEVMNFGNNGTEDIDVNVATFDILAGTTTIADGVTLVSNSDSMTLGNGNGTLTINVTTLNSAGNVNFNAGTITMADATTLTVESNAIQLGDEITDDINILGTIRRGNVAGAGSPGTDPVDIDDSLFVRGRMQVRGGTFTAGGVATSDAAPPLPGSNEQTAAFAVAGTVHINDDPGGLLGGLRVSGTITTGENIILNVGEIQDTDGTVNVADGLDVDGPIEGNSLDLNGGAITDVGSLNVTNNIQGGSLTITTTGTFGTTLSVGTSLTVGTTGTFNGLLTANAGLAVTAGGAAITGATSVTGSFTQSGGANTFGGASTFNSTLTVAGGNDAFFTGDVDVEGTIFNAAAATVVVQDNMQINGNLIVTGTSDLQNTIFNSSANNSGRVFISDANGFQTDTNTPSFFGEDVQVGTAAIPANSQLFGTLAVGNATNFFASTFNGDVNVLGNEAISAGTQFIVGSLASTDTNVPSIFNGNVTMNQIVTIGDNTNTPANDSLTVNSAIITLGDAAADTMTVNASTTFVDTAALTINSNVVTTMDDAGDTWAFNAGTVTHADGTTLTINSTTTTIGNAGTDALNINASTTLSNGATLVVSSNAATIGDNAADILTVNSTTTFANNVTINGDLTGNGGAGALTVNGDASITGNTTIGDAAADTLTVNATSTFNAPATFVDAATLTIDSNTVNAMDDAGDVWNFNNGTLTHADANTLVLNSNTITASDDAGDSFTFSNGTTTHADANTLVLNANTITASDDAGDSFTFSNGTTTHADSNTLVVNSNVATIGNVGTDTLTVNSSSTFTNGATLVVSSNVATIGDSGTDVLTINSSTTFSDGATIVINSNSVDAMDDAGDVWNFNNGTITHADANTIAFNSNTVNAMDDAGDNWSFNSGTLTTANANTLVFNSNAATIGNAGTDVLTVNSATTFTGSVTGLGTVNLLGNTTIGDSSGDALTVNATSTFNANVTMNANTTIGNSTGDVLQVNATSAFGNNGTGFNGGSNLIPGNAVTIWGNSTFSGVHTQRRATNGATTITLDGETGKITAQQLQVTGQKNFITPNPVDPTKQIVYVAPEGAESGVYHRGKADLKKGNTRVELPTTFSLVASAEELTATATPVGKPARVWIVEQTPTYVVFGSDEDVRVNFRVDGVRAGFENHEAMEINTAFLPETVDQVNTFPVGVIAQLKKNGIVNADGTPNVELVKKIKSSNKK